MLTDERVDCHLCAPSYLCHAVGDCKHDIRCCPGLTFDVAMDLGDESDVESIC
jgi:hypothetical protein